MTVAPNCGETELKAIGSPLKMKKNALYFTAKALLRYGKTRVTS